MSTSETSYGNDCRPASFLGRTTELELLSDAWGLAAKGTPQMRIIAAESGYGKTRLVQAFYAWLARERDPLGYWPRSLAAEAENLRVMPKIEQIESGRKAPWFWWGLRWVDDPGGRNLPEQLSPFIASIHEPAFVSHQNALLLAASERKALNEVLVASGKVLLGISGVGAAKDLVDAIDQIQGFLGILKTRREHMNLSKGKAVAESQAFERILTILALLLDPAKGTDGALPVVLVLDDAHWIDDFSMSVVHAVWTKACERKWPLLLIATSWQSEWHRGNGIAHFFKRNCSESGAIQCMALGRLEEDNVRRIIGKSFPGMEAGQLDFFVGKADGNPRHANELVMLLTDMADEWFEDGDKARELKPEGFKQAQAEELDLESLEKKRFRKVQLKVKDALGAGSCQGEVFLCEFAVEVARALKLPDADRHALQEAHIPFALAEALDGETMEFRSRIISSLACKHLAAKASEPTIIAAISEVFSAWAKDNKLETLKTNQAERLLNSITALDTDRTTKLLASAEGLALCDKDPSSHALAHWTTKWLELAPVSQDLSELDFAKLRTATKALYHAGEKSEALRICRDLHGRAEFNDADPSLQADCLFLLAYISGELEVQPPSEVSEIYKQCVSLREKVLNSEHNHDNLRRLSHAYDALGRFLILQDEESIEALEYLVLAVKVAQETLDKTQSIETIQRLAFAKRYLAECYRLRKDVQLSQLACTQSIELWREAETRFGASRNITHGLAYALFSRASLEDDQSHWQEAMRSVEEAIGELDKLRIGGGFIPSDFGLYESCCKLKAHILLNNFDSSDEARDSLQVALDACRSSLAKLPAHPELLESEKKLASLIAQIKADV